jgi:ABC-type sugar transport system permease subunit
VESVHSKVKGLFRVVYFMPAISSTVLVALIWNIIYHPQQGLLNLLLKSLGLPTPRAWLSDPQAFVFGVPLALLAVMVALAWQEFGYNLVIFISALQGIPQVFRDSARVDGANAWQEFWGITLPLLQPTLLFVMVLSVLSTLQQFVIFQVMTNGGPNFQTYTLVLNLYQSAFRYQAMGWGAAISMVLFALIGFVTVIQFRLLRTRWEY